MRAGTGAPPQPHLGTPKQRGCCSRAQRAAPSRWVGLWSALVSQATFDRAAAPRREGSRGRSPCSLPGRRRGRRPSAAWAHPQACRRPAAQVRRCAVRIGTPGPVRLLLRELPCASGACATQEAGTRTPCVRHGCGSMAHVSTQPGTAVIMFLYSANAGIVIPICEG